MELHNQIFGIIFGLPNKFHPGGFKTCQQNQVFSKTYCLGRHIIGLLIPDNYVKYTLCTI